MSDLSLCNSGSGRHQFRWRAVPVAIVGAIGCTSLLFGLVSLFTNAKADEIFDNVWNIFFGSSFIAASILIWNRRWRLGAAVIAICLSFPLALFLWAIYMIK